MSAICGIFYRNGKLVDPALINNMTTSMYNFTTDYTKYWQNKNIGFGQQMTYFTPESVNEHLPFYDSTNKLTIIADVRIDNRIELCNLLQLDNSICDSQILLAAYNKWDIDFPKHILGDFAVAIWNENKQELICATSIFAVYPIYYFCNNEIFAFATDINVLHQIPEIKRLPNLSMIAEYYIFAFPIDENFATNYQNIYYIPGSQIIKVNSNKFEQTKYWKPDINKRLNLKTEKEYADGLKDIFTQAVQDRIRSNYEIGVLLSGGLDSSAITSIASPILQQENKILHAFSNVLPENYSGPATDEKEYIKLFEGANIDINYLDQPLNLSIDNLQQNLIKNTVHPSIIADFYTINNYLILAKSKNIRTLLNGTLSELGPSNYGWGYYTELLLQCKLVYLWRELTAMAKLNNTSRFKIFITQVIRPIVPNIAFKIFSSSVKQELNMIRIPYQPKFIRNYNPKSKTSHKKLFAATNHRIHQYNMILYFQNMNIGAILENNVNRSFPFLDKRVIDFCLAAPGSMKLNNGYQRYLIRSSMHGVTDKKICKRLTKGAAYPWMPQFMNKEIPNLKILLANIPKDSYAAKILDLDRLKLLINMPSPEQNTYLLDHTIPQALSLAYFLNSFPTPEE